MELEPMVAVAVGGEAQAPARKHRLEPEAAERDSQVTDRPAPVDTQVPDSWGKPAAAARAQHKGSRVRPAAAQEAAPPHPRFGARTWSTACRCP